MDTKEEEKYLDVFEFRYLNTCSRGVTVIFGSGIGN